MSELSNLLKNTDFENISLEELVHLEDSLQRFENTTEKSVLEKLKQKIADKYISFRPHTDVRFTVHKIRTGYDEEGWGNGEGDISREDLQKLNKRSEKGWDPNNGWKFHLDVVPNRNHPVTKAVSEFLLDLNVNHKIAAGGVGGKGMTVYVGSYDDVNQLAEVIQERFGKDIYEPPVYTAQRKQEYAFQPTVYGRFVPGRNGDYPRGLKGVGLVYADYYDAGVTFPTSLEKAIELGLVENKDSIFHDENFWHRKKRKQGKEEDLLLRNYCCHKLYAEALGNYYCGRNIGEFEKKFFGDKLPAKGTEKRKKWDEVAKVFVEEAKTIVYGGKKFFDFLKGFTEGYQPLDLSRVKTKTRSKDTPKQEEKEQSSSQRLNEAKKRITEQEKQKDQDKYAAAKDRKEVVHTNEKSADSKNTPKQEKKEQNSSQRLEEARKRVTEQEKQRDQDRYAAAKGRKDVVYTNEKSAEILHRRYIQTHSSNR